MFNEELLKLVIQLKEEELEEQKNQIPMDTQVIENLEKEIKYLKIVFVLYELAKILKLDNNETYIRQDYIGIENENLNNYPLTQFDRIRYNQLLSEIPVEERQRYQIRQQMKNILKNSDKELFQIEQEDPTLAEYHLNQNEIDEFNRLKEEIKKLGIETTKKVDYQKEAINIIKEELKKLDNLDAIEYQTRKEKSLKKIDKIVEKISDQSKENVFTNISNYQLEKDLLEKYPNMNITMSISGLEKLLSTLQNNQLTEQEYREHIKVFGNNINKLYEDDKNKKEIELLLSKIPEDNYPLRNDISNIINKIDNTNVKIEDKELDSIMKLLDNNYDRMKQEEQEKYYNIVKRMITKKSNDLNQIQELNQMMLSVKNKQLRDKLTLDFAKTRNVEVQNKHKDSYSDLIEEQIQKIEKEKAKYINNNSNSEIFNTRNDIKIKELDKQIEHLRSMDVNYENNIALHLLDSQYNTKTEEEIKLQQEIKRLQELKEQINSKFYKRLMDKKIEKRNKKIQKIQKSKTKIVGIQKKMMLPKYYVNQRIGKVERHFESKQEVFETYSKDYRKLSDAEREMNGMFSGIKAAFYDYKAGKYQRKADRNQKICELLQKGKVTIKGNNIHLINKNLLNQLRQKQTVAQQAI